jgi:hypothetical protein
MGQEKPGPAVERHEERGLPRCRIFRRNHQRRRQDDRFTRPPLPAGKITVSGNKALSAEKINGIIRTDDLLFHSLIWLRLDSLVPTRS